MAKRQIILELLAKIQSEGMDYYFTGYAGPEALDNEPVPENLKEAARQYGKARDVLVEGLRKLAKDNKISQDEIEGFD